MRIIAIMPCRNSGWILGLSARAVLQWCDELLVLNHASTDDTDRVCEQVCHETGGRLRCWWKDDNQWPEMEHRQFLLEKARERGATHIVTVDDDEVLTANMLPEIRGIIERLRPEYTLQLPWLCLRGGIDKYHASGIWSQSYASVAWQDDPRCHWSSAERGGYQYHHRHPMGRPLAPWMTSRALGGLMHLQFVDEPRLRAKQFWYCLQERLRWPNLKTPQQVVDYYSPAVYGHAANDPNPVVLSPVPTEWWAGYEPLMQYFHPERESWQLEECRRIIRENPGIEAGLDNFGLALQSLYA